MQRCVYIDTFKGLRGMISSINNCQTISCEYTFQPNRHLKLANSDEKGPPQVTDSVTISVQGKELLKVDNGNRVNAPGKEELTEDEKREIEQLKKVDRDVKAHERAHMSAGAGVVMGGASYEYKIGPDRRMYAVGGEVKIDTSRENNPEATVRKMQEVKRAALAPAQPSGTDRQVAAQAVQIEAEARIEAAEEKRKEAEEENAVQGPASPKNLMTLSQGPVDFKTRGNTVNIRV
jgi:hypothetical protein